MRLGRRMVTGGFALALAGVVAYCLVSFSAPVDGDGAQAALGESGRAMSGALATLGLGTLLWLAGSFIHLRGAMDLDAGPDAR